MSDGELSMNNFQRQAWIRIGAAMGLQVDELGHPYRQGAAYVLEGETYHHLHDFDPLHDPADAFRVQLHFNLSVEAEQDVVVVREGYGPILLVASLDASSPETRVAGACNAVFDAAAKLLARKEIRNESGGE